MQGWNSRQRNLPEVFAPDERPGADTHVYCKGCGEPLDGAARRVANREPITSMMCPTCQERHHHAFIPASGAASFCYRCGGLDAVFVGRGTVPAIYHVCPRCVPDRVKRYRSGNYEQPLRPVEVIPVKSAVADPAETASTQG